MHVGTITKKLTSIRAIFLLLLLCGLTFSSRPAAIEADVIATAESAGFGAAFGYAQTIATHSYAQAGTIGNGWAGAEAATFGTGSLVEVWTGGQAAAFAQSIGTPFGSTAFVQLSSFTDGFAFTYARSYP